MNEFSLNGPWTIECAQRDVIIPGRVPGDVHHDLLNAEAIPDPFYRLQEDQLQWIGQSDWTYHRSFTVPEEVRAHERVLLVCGGLDTLATIELNGTPVGTADNMHRTWEWDVGPLLQEGENLISVNFASAVTHALEANRREMPFHWERPATATGYSGTAGPFSMVRKEACNFGWDWGTRAVTCGIWRDITLVGFSTARIDHLQILQQHADGAVTLQLSASLDRLADSALTGKAVLTRNGTPVAEGACGFGGTTGTMELTLANPELWWPNNMGDQPLYALDFSVCDPEGGVLDRHTRTLGLRTIEVDRHKDEWGESFQFKVNGIPFFAKGANWIPVDAILGRVTRDDYERLIRDAAAVHMNMLRIWGGGIYEADAFYELCSQHGLLVWQDFMYACSAYPLNEDAFLATATAEAEDQVKRLHHHACLALWCGNNEMESMSVADSWSPRHMSWKDYSVFFDDVLGDVVAQHHPGAVYWPSSPHSTIGDRSNTESDESGDAHLWAVWHGKEPFEWYRTAMHRFVSEFGFQSFPEPKTVYAYTEPRDRNITAHVMEFHQRSHIGNARIMEYMLNWYRLPSGFESTLWTSQIQQGMAITYAVEHWRRHMPRCMGSLYWQLNDYWPVASWASIDYHGRWKALHYMARRFYAPVLVSGVEDMANGTAEIHVSSDLLADTAAVVTCTVTDLNGTELMIDKAEVRVAANQSQRLQTLECRSLIDQYGAGNIILWLDLEMENGERSANQVLFCRPKYMDLVDPGFTRTLTEQADGTFRLELEARAVALWTWFELSGSDAVFSDSFFCLRPGMPSVIDITPREPISLEAVEAQLRVRSLVDTY